MTASLRFGRFVLKQHERRLLDNGHPVNIESRAYDLLVELARRGGEVVSKDELIERVWPGLVVEENNLQVQVSRLRRAIGSDAIKTITGRGYQLAWRPVPDEGTDVTAAKLHGELPAVRGRFIGRERDVAICIDMLRTTRLLTIAAIGGCGKTRLAIEVARLLAADTPGGVSFINLAHLSDASGIALNIGQTVRVFEQPGLALCDTLAFAIGSERALLVLDNCEQAMPAVTMLVSVLLARCPHLRIIATSRLPTHHRLERVHALAPLEVPGVGAHANMLSYDAVQLFIDRVKWADASFKVDEAQLESVADICRRLDGIPLALELAAARARLLSLGEIRDRLDDRFKLLTSPASGLRGQQTLLATIQWSYDQLHADVQKRLRHLSVISGGWTLETATALSDEDACEFSTLDALDQLANLSLVVVERHPGEETRYQFLETVRTFASELLREAGEDGMACERHWRRYVALAAAFSTDVRAADQRRWLRRIDLERENLVAAHDECAASREGVQAALVLTASMEGYWRSRGLVNLGHRLACDAVARAASCAPSRAHARALFCAGELAYFIGHHAQACDYLERSDELGRQMGDEDVQVAARLMLGVSCLGLDRDEQAQLHARAALEMARKKGDLGLINIAVMALGAIHLALGTLEQAAALFEESLAIARQRNAPINEGLSLVNIAWAALGRGQETKAWVALEQAIAVVLDLGHEAMGQMTIDLVVGLSALRGEWEVAARFFGAAQASIDYTGQRRQPAIARRLLPLMARRPNGPEAASFAALEAEGRRLHHAAALRAVSELVRAQSSRALVA